MDFFKCPVCQQKLIRKDSTYECALHHVYDISHKGYTNFLLANQHHSFNPGDSKEMIAARVRFLTTEKYHVLRKKIYECIETHFAMQNEIYFGDIACGEGYYTNYIHKQLSFHHNVMTVGIDISKYGILECCKKQRSEKLENIEYVIGNLSNLPFLSDTFHLLLNCFAPMDDLEFYRVLKNGGLYIRVLPDFDHLWELKEVLYQSVKPNIMKNIEIDGFQLLDKITIKDEILLENNQQINDLFMMTPYYYKSPLDTSKKLQAMNQLKTKISFVLLVYQKMDKKGERI